jgi:hypothetical protein
MPNYAIYDPTTTPVSNLVTRLLQSFDEGRESELPATRVKNPNLTSVDPGKPMRWNGSAIVNLTQAQIDSITSANAALQLSQLKLAAKNLMITPSGFEQQAIRLAIITVLLDVMLPLINTLRTDPTTSFAALTNTQVEDTFKTAYEGRVDALS